LQRGEALADPDQAGAYFQRKLRPLPHEVFACLFLDTRHRVLAYEELFRGTLDGSEVHPREVARRCLAHNAAAVIFGHNHPSGNPEASAADRAVTARLKQALALVEVRVLDHFIIGDGSPSSMARRGWL
jgi:DNA repair protein RadC